MLVFVDFDGVLHPATGQLFSCRGRFERLMREFPAVEIVISSSWRYEQPLDRLRSYFSPDIARRIVGATPTKIDGHWPHYRHHEIMAFLQDHPGRPWLAIDDAADGFPADCQELYLCDGRLGMTRADLRQLRGRMSEIVA